jgi:hypothetical protein
MVTMRNITAKHGIEKAVFLDGEESKMARAHARSPHEEKARINLTWTMGCEERWGREMMRERRQRRERCIGRGGGGGSGLNWRGWG